MEDNVDFQKSKYKQSANKLKEEHDMKIKQDSKNNDPNNDRNQSPLIPSKQPLYLIMKTIIMMRIMWMMRFWHKL